MLGLRSKIPSPNWLVTFEAAARCLSFTRAAEELNVTRVAVSQQVKALEGFLGAQLFERLHRSLRLTRAGEQYHRVIAASLQSILTATYEIQKSQKRKVVTVTTTTGFATYWLLPRIGDFRRLHPDIDLQFLIADTYLDLAVNEVDVAVRYGDGEWPNVHAAFLLREEIYPLCSRSYMEGRAALEHPKDLLDERLLHLDGPYDPDTRWLGWFRRNGVDLDHPPQGLRVNTYTNLVQAALDGQGIALIGPPLMERFLEGNVLVRPIAAAAIQRRAFYLVLPGDQPPNAETSIFCDWIEGAVRGMAGPAPAGDAH